jgi:hypothetical protein
MTDEISGLALSESEQREDDGDRDSDDQQGENRGAVGMYQIQGIVIRFRPPDAPPNPWSQAA